MTEPQLHIQGDPYDDGQRYDSIEGLVTRSLRRSEPVYLHGSPYELYQAGLLLIFKKDYDSALQHFDRAAYLYEQQKEPFGQIQCLIEMGWLKYNDANGGYPKAKLTFEEARSLITQFRGELDHLTELESRLIHYEGLVKYREKQYGEAIRLFRQALSLCPKKSLEAAKINDSLAIYYERTGNFSRGLDCLKKSLEIKKTLDIPLQEAITAQILGRMCLAKEDYDLASQYLTHSLQIIEPLQDIRREVSLKNQLAKMYIQQGQFEAAQQLIQELIPRLQNKAGYEREYGSTLLHQCLLLYKEKHLHEARQLLNDEAIPFCSRHHLNKCLGKAFRLSAQIERKLLDSGDALEKAIEKLGQSIALFKDEGLVDELAKTHYELGKLYNTVCENTLALDAFLDGLKIAEANGLTFIAGYIEDQIYLTDVNFWQEIVDKRAKHQRIFEDDRTLLETLALRSHHDSDPDDSTHKERQLMVSLLRVGQAMSGERDLEKLLLLITEETKSALNADRCTVFLYDPLKNELWSKVGTGIGATEEIRFPAHMGLAGYVCKTGEVLNIPVAYDDPRFNQAVDKQTGYKTENILCMPMRNRNNDIIGVFQVLNKQDGAFDGTDEELLMAITSQAGVTLENAQLAQEQKTAFMSFVKTLSSTIDARDPITAGHSDRVAQYSSVIGKQLHLNGEEMEVLFYSSLLHDIGKIGIREDVLTKDGRLTEKEYRHIQKHAEYTYEILKNIHFEKHLKRVPEIAAVHHEKMDGSGYFRGLKGAEIPLLGRILALSDVFDAITSRRHYRNRMPFERVIKILRKDAGSHFDPDCVDAFFNSTLYDLATVLTLDQNDDHREALIQPIHPTVTVREFEALINKATKSPGEESIYYAFNRLYQLAELETRID